ncbi:S41 family peptidase [Variovorax sp. OV329]|uniref:S41 family peptidase n=1 Tax=Variovorax sp. OV329 TaxID=1882825 RepID=UPI0008ECAD9D|nr:S41 family peptidase [Variovorax sp. OV329]SFM28142.1 Peptidase family S41 [Variovorax sp. OV329]
MKSACRVLSIALTSAVLAACGGGGGSDNSPLNPSGGASAASVAGLCANPRSGLDPATGRAFTDRAGSLDTEKSWVRAWIDDTYLWYDEVPADLKASDYGTPQAYFADLKTPSKTASGQPKDRFHFTQDTASYQSFVSDSTTIGYGMEVAVLRSAPPREVRVAFVTPGGPAALAGLARGDRLLTLDGADVAAGSATTLNAALAPQRAGEVHSMVASSAASGTRGVTLTAASVSTPPVMNVKALPVAGSTVGYLQFNDHTELAESQLVAAFQQLKTLGVTDLVLDMRYNGGGLLGVASELAYMVAGPVVTQGKTFERLVTNHKNPYGMSAAQSTYPFQSTALGYSTAAGQPLPFLGLNKVTVLSGPDTCSASESVVNGLRGVGVQVDLVGNTTCGKPYGFFAQGNCGTTYFAINFQGVNAQGFGDYGDGMAPKCAVADDFEHALGDPQEARLAAALNLRAGGTCPAASGSGSGSQKAGGTLVEAPYLRRDPMREIKRIDPLMQPQT